MGKQGLFSNGTACCHERSGSSKQEKNLHFRQSTPILPGSAHRINILKDINSPLLREEEYEMKVQVFDAWNNLLSLEDDEDSRETISASASRPGLLKLFAPSY